MKAVVTGQVGLDKRPYLQQVVDLARQAGHAVELLNVGEMMYAEAPDIAPGRILDLSLGRLTSLRRAVFKDIITACERHENVIINTHAAFRWRHGLFFAFDYDQMQALHADSYVCLVDNIDAVHCRLLKDGHTEHGLKDLIVWREEEVLITELLSQIVRGHGRFFIQARGADGSTIETMYKLLFKPHLRKAYLSFPMSHVMNCPEILTDIEIFRRRMKEYFTCFDPGDVEEKYLCQLALSALEQGQRTVSVKSQGKLLALDAQELVGIIGDIDGQIYARDFKLIDQSDMIISYIPELPSGSPGLSSGVERELQHAHEAAKEVFVIWQPKANPSPFITETATEVFHSMSEAVQYFLEGNFIPPPPGGLFA